MLVRQKNAGGVRDGHKCWREWDWEPTELLPGGGSHKCICIEVSFANKTNYVKYNFPVSLALVSAWATGAWVLGAPLLLIYTSPIFLGCRADLVFRCRVLFLSFTVKEVGRWLGNVV